MAFLELGVQRAYTVEASFYRPGPVAKEEASESEPESSGSNEDFAEAAAILLKQVVPRPPGACPRWSAVTRRCRWRGKAPRSSLRSTWRSLRGAGAVARMAAQVSGPGLGVA